MIRNIDTDLLGEIHYLNASSRGGTEVARLPIVRAHVAPFGEDLDAIVACSDLQGMTRGALLGVHVAEVVAELVNPARTGVILAGDLYSVPAANKRGGFGPVAHVWEEFAARFAWVAGVAGNHDDVTGIAGRAGMYLLDGDTVELDGLRIGGVGGIIGNKRKPGRRSEDEQVALVERVLDHGVDILVMHEGPCGDDAQPGNALMRELVQAAGVPLAICGHSHWREPLSVHDHGQVLNVDTRVVVMVSE